MWISKTPADGNCLPASIVRVLQGTKIGTTSHYQAIKELRQKCFNYIVEHLDDFRIIILNEICEMRRWELEHVLNTEHGDLIQNYLDEMLKDGAWCGSEMIAAAANLYQAEFIIYTTDSEPWRFTVSDAITRINLFYSGRVQKNHYDVVIKVDSCTFKSGEQDMEKKTVQKEPLYAANQKAFGDRFFEAIVKAWLGPHLSQWQLDVNALNLRRATIKELSYNYRYYVSNSSVFYGMSREQFMDVLTHWNEAENYVDIEIGTAVAEILHAIIIISTSRTETIIYKPHSGDASKKIAIQEIQAGIFVPINTMSGLCDYDDSNNAR